MVYPGRLNPAKNPQQILKNARAEIRLNGYRKPPAGKQPEMPLITLINVT